VSRDRARRADRVVEVRERATRLAESGLAEATKAVRAAEIAVFEARKAWEVAASKTIDGPCSSLDLADAHAQLGYLQKTVETKLTVQVQAQMAEHAARAALTAARVEQKKVETWQEGLLNAALNDEAYKERRATDELAASRARRA
jgi:flagellar export protein FliJ